MIEFISTFEGPPISVHASIRGMAIYLDTFAVIGLAKDDQRRRQRFLDTLHSGADVLFSVSTLDLLGRSDVATAPVFAKEFAVDQRPGPGVLGG